jgi:prepilin-type processing-associated H-X9-DG protein
LVVGIIAALVALLLPATRSARPAARRAQCTNNLKQIALALYNYEQMYHALPPAHTVDAEGQPLHSWRTLILPFLEQEPLYRSIDLTKPWNDASNAHALAKPLNVFQCPEVLEISNRTTYLAVVSPDGYLHPNRSRRLSEIADPHGETLAVIEADDEHAVPWMAPVDADESLVLGLGPNTKHHHAGGMNTSFVDGSVRFVKAGTPAQVRRAWITISGHDNQFKNDW